MAAAVHNTWVNVYSGSLPLTGYPDTYLCGPNTTLRCIYKNDKTIGDVIQWVIYTDNGRNEKVLKYRLISDDGLTVFMDYLITSSGNYSCGYDNIRYKTVNISISVSSNI